MSHSSEHLRVIPTHFSHHRQVAWECNKEWLSRVWFLSTSTQPFLVQLSLRLTAQIFAPQEICPPCRLYIVHRGVALCGGKVYTGGGVWGEDMLLTSQHLQKPFCARAMIFLSVFSLSRYELMECASFFPIEYRKIRSTAITLATRRAFILEAVSGELDPDSSLLLLWLRVFTSAPHPTSGQARRKRERGTRSNDSFVKRVDPDRWGEREEMLAIAAANASLVYHRQMGYPIPDGKATTSSAFHGTALPNNLPTRSKVLLLEVAGQQGGQSGRTLLETLDAQVPLLEGLLASHKQMAQKMRRDLEQRDATERTLNARIVQQQAELAAVRKEVEAVTKRGGAVLNA